MTDDLSAFKATIYPMAKMAAITYRAFRTEGVPRILAYLLTALIVQYSMTGAQRQATVVAWPSPIQYREAA